MSFYDNGSIILVKNIVFKEGELDHSYKHGRPCLIIDNDEEEITFLTIATVYKDKNYCSNYVLNNWRKLDLKHESYVNLASIYKEKACFYKEINRIDQIEYLKILKEFLLFHKYNHEIDSVKKAVNKQLKLNKIIV